MQRDRLTERRIDISNPSFWFVEEGMKYWTTLSEDFILEWGPVLNPLSYYSYSEQKSKLV